MSEQTPQTTELSIPGPWRLDDPVNAAVLGDNDGYHVIEGDGKTEHLRVTGFFPIDIAHLITAAPDMRAMLDEAAPFLRQLAQHCEACEGAGEIVTGPSDEEATSEPCTHCKPLWDLIERVETPLVPAPAPVQPTPAVEEEDDVLF